MTKPLAMIKEQMIDAAEYVLGFVLVFLLPLQAALIATGCLIFLDTVTGIWKVVTTDGWSKVQSKKLAGVVPKMILYVIAIITAQIAQDYLSPAIPWVDVTTGIISIIEVKSIFENIKAIIGIDIWKELRDKIGRKPLDDDSGDK
jgi:hypothetical protein